MLDYHLHLWPHEFAETPLSLDQIAAYCEHAQAAGVKEIALTEHLHRFVDGREAIGHFWADEPDLGLRASMDAYFDHHAHADLAAYVDLCLEAKAAGLPVVMGMEVDYCPGRMDKIGELLGQFPFDVLLGSVHWLGSWRFDDLADPASQAQWGARSIDHCFEDYTRAMEELAATKSCDVLAHPDLIKVAGHQPDAPQEWWDRIAEAAAKHASVVELSSAGWRKPVGEQYPALGLLERFVARGVQFTTASDAHRVDQVADHVPEMRSLLLSQGVDQLVRFSERKGHALAIEEAH